jgi:uncharacterized membrane protein HdeD (DUF308 family)
MENNTHETEKINPAMTETLEAAECNCILPGILKASRAALIWRGIVFMVFGILMLLQPITTFTVIVLILGVYAIIEGAAMLTGALQLPQKTRSMLTINGIVLVLLGIAAIAFPWLMGEYAIVFLGVWQFISGIQCLVLIKSSHHRWKTFFSGILTIAAGIFFVIAPFIGLLAMTWLFALLFFFTGVLMLYSGATMTVKEPIV